MIILATQKKIMSKPVTNRFVGKKVLRFFDSFGHPIDAKGQRLEENHVSKTSSSCLSDLLSSE